LRRRDYNGSLVSSRNTIEVLIEDEKINELIKKYYSEDEINYCMLTLKQEKDKKDLFISTNTKISEYMEERDTRLKNINWND